MRTFQPIEPPRDIDPRLYNSLKNLNTYLAQINAALGNIQRGESPIAAGTPLIPTITIVSSTPLNGVQFRRVAGQTADLLQFLTETNTVMSYVRASDGAFVGPVVASGTDTHPDSIFRLVDDVDNTKQVAFQLSGVAAGTTRTLSVPDVTASLILTQGTSSGQVIGVGVHTTGTASSIVIEGPVMIGDGLSSVNFLAGRVLDVRHGVANAGTMINLQSVVTAVTGAASGTLTNLQVSLSGTPGYTSGSFIPRGFFFTGTMAIPSGVTASDAYGALIQASFTGPGTITKSEALQARVLGSNVSITGTTAELGSIDAQVNQRSSPVTLAYAFRASDTAGIKVGAVAQAVAFDVAATFQANALTVNWTGLRIPTITGPTGTILGLDIAPDSQLSNLSLTGNLTIADAKNIILNATTGTKFGTAATQKIGFWNTAPIVQPAVGGAAAAFVANTSAIVDDSATFDGYTLGQVVKALRNLGVLA